MRYIIKNCSVSIVSNVCNKPKKKINYFIFCLFFYNKVGVISYLKQNF